MSTVSGWRWRVAFGILGAWLVALGGLGTSVSGAQGDDGRTVLLQATLRRLPETPTTLRLRRVTIAQGAAIPLHTAPGPEFAIVESGLLTVRVDGEASTLRPAEAARGNAGRAVAPRGTPVALAPADQIALPADTPRAYANSGVAPVSLLIASVLPSRDGESPPEQVWTGQEPDAGALNGVEATTLGEATVAELPPAPAAVTLEHLSLTAGQRIPAYPGPTLVCVDEGAFGTNIVAGEARISRGGLPATDEPGGVLTVGEGDAIVFPTGMAASPPLGGEGRLVVLRLGIVPVASEDDATPDA